MRNSFDILHVTDLTDGRKLRAIRSIPSTPPAVAMEGGTGGEAETTVTDYCGDYIYEDGAIERINTPAGYLSFRDNYGDRLDTPRHIFFLRDHLGNNRVALDGANGAIMQINHYYPFGMPMNAGLNTGFQPWKFGGKEFDRTAGLDLYDFEARAYDPSTARFLRHDDLTEKYLPLSPYTYCANNPLRLIDPTGMDWVTAEYGEHLFYFFHKDITAQTDLTTIFGEGTNVKYLGKSEEYLLVNNPETDTNTAISLYEDGSYAVNDISYSSDMEYDINSIHIGSNDDQVNRLSNDNANFYGSYYGPLNPMKGDKYSYVTPPSNYLDFAAFQHDRDYDKVGAVGPLDALQNTRTSTADLYLSLRSYKQVAYGHSFKERFAALGSGYSFFWIYLYKMAKNVLYTDKE